MKRRTQSAVWLSLAVAAAVMAVMSASRGTAKLRRPHATRDYSDRSGLPLGVKASRGVATDALAADNARDFRQPEALQPLT